jgi:nucleotide-binding universal stress UspA family protein
VTTAQIGPVLAGIDYSPDSMAAVELAAWEAKRRRLPLRLVHALSPPPAFGLGYGSGWMHTVMVRDCERMLAEATAQVQHRHPGLELSHLAVTGSPAAALVTGSELASLVVVGARGAGGFPDLLAGSVSGQVATHAHAPVIVVRRSGAEDVPPAGPVVVGVDGSAASTDAVAFAFEEADARRTNLVAVYAWDVPPQHNLGPITRRHYDPLEAQDEAERVLAEAVCGWTDKYPDVAVSRLAIHTLTPAAVLREAAAGAALIVVGSRGHGGFAGLLLGSVSRALVSHASSSVAVVHDGVARASRP